MTASADESPDPDLGLSKPISELASLTSRRRRGRSSRNATPFNQFGPRSSSSNDPSSSISSIFADPPIAPGTMYHPIPVDDTHRIGAAGLLFTSALATAEAPLPGIPGMPNLGPLPEDALGFLDQLDPNPPPIDPKIAIRPQPHGEKTYFGLSRQCRLLSDLVSMPQHSAVETRWSKVEPYRFSVEFWDLPTLVERERVYSTTHFFAGSWFNVYVQTIRKKEKGVQLGVYLHRQSPGEPFPVPSAPGGESSAPTAPLPGGLGLTGGVPLGRSTTGHVTVGSPRAGDGSGPDEELSEEIRRKEAYRDNRPATKVSDLNDDTDFWLCIVLILSIGLLFTHMRLSTRYCSHPILVSSR